jgi:hypothetical protein
MAAVWSAFKAALIRTFVLHPKGRRAPSDAACQLPTETQALVEAGVALILVHSAGSATAAA